MLFVLQGVVSLAVLVQQRLSWDITLETGSVWPLRRNNGVRMSVLGEHLLSLLDNLVDFVLVSEILVIVELVTNFQHRRAPNVSAVNPRFSEAKRLSIQRLHEPLVLLLKRHSKLNISTVSG